MGKIALLVPKDEMLYQAHNILQEKKYEIWDMQVVSTETAVAEAQQLIAAGASILIARGLQASLIKQQTDIPVVEIVLTAQEMALLIMRAKQIIKKAKPVIAVVGFRNMFCDMSYFNELFQIELRTYFVSDGEELEYLTRLAIKEQADLIIGGDIAVAVASENGIPSLFLSTTEESLRQAFLIAERMEYAINAEKKSAAQMETLLDYSYNGILRFNADGKIIAVNQVFESMIGKTREELKDQPIQQVVSGIEETGIRQVLEEGKEYLTFVEWNRVSIFAALAPVLVENQVDGGILTCHRAKQQRVPEKRECEKKEQIKLPPFTQFSDLLQQSPLMKRCVQRAKQYAISERPVVLIGEAGTEKRMLAESMHNSSSRSSGPFLAVSGRGVSDEEQKNLLFGEQGAVVLAQGGTLLIQEAEYLTAANQERLCELIRYKSCFGIRTKLGSKLDVRIMVTVEHSLAELRRKKKLDGEFYYLLSGLELEIPPLRMRSEDLVRKLEDTIRECNERYGRYHVLTNGAKQVLWNYLWEGNLLQVDSFCERMILTATSRSLDEIFVRELLEELYSKKTELEKSENSVQNRDKFEVGEVKNKEAERIRELLQIYGGNREKTAEALGISKATLWRHMKKFGIR